MQCTPALHNSDTVKLRQINSLFHSISYILLRERPGCLSHFNLGPLQLHATKQLLCPALNYRIFCRLSTLRFYEITTTSVAFIAQH